MLDRAVSPSKARLRNCRRKALSEIPASLDQRCWKWVAIRQLQPGLRVRLPFNMSCTRALLNLIANEEGAKMVFDMAVERTGSLGVAAAEEARGLEDVTP